MASTTKGAIDEFIGLATAGGKAAGIDASNTIHVREGKSSSGITRLWTNKLKGFGLYPAVAKLKNDVLYIAINGRILAVNAITGTDMWLQYPETQKGFFNVSSFLDMLVPQDEDCIYFSQVGRIVKLNGTNGSIIWDQSAEVSGFSKYGTVTLLDAGTFLIAAIQGIVCAYDKNDGKQVWKNDLKGKGYSPVSVALHKNILVAGIYGYLVSIHVQTGEKIAEFNIKGTGFSVVTLLMDPINDGRLYAACSGECRALTVHGGTFTELWKSELPGMGYSQGHSLFLDHTEDSVKTLIVGMAGKVCALDPQQGQNIKWKNELKGCGYDFVTLNDFNDTTLLAAINGRLVGINKRSGDTEWVDELEGLGYCQLVVATKRQNVDFNNTTLPHWLEFQQRNSN